jgi:hypothetical protein
MHRVVQTARRSAPSRTVRSRTTPSNFGPPMVRLAAPTDGQAGAISIRRSTRHGDITHAVKVLPGMNSLSHRSPAAQASDASSSQSRAQ